MGVEAVLRQRGGMLGYQLKIPVELNHSARRMSVRSAHHRDQETALWQRVELVCDGRQRRVGGSEKLRPSGISNVEEEDLLLSLENAQQSACGQHATVSRESDVMRLVACRAGAWERYGRDHATVIMRMLVEVDHCKKVGIGPRLVASPDEEVFLVIILIGAHDVDACE